MAFISLTKLGTTCKLCIGIYVASAACLVGALVLWRRASGGAPRAAEVPASTRDRHEDPAWVGGGAKPAVATEAPVAAQSSAGTSSRFLAGALAAGVVFVVAPVVLYAAAAPDHARFIGTCDALPHPED